MEAGNAASFQLLECITLRGINERRVVTGSNPFEISLLRVDGQTPPHLRLELLDDGAVGGLDALDDLRDVERASVGERAVGQG